MSSRIALFLLFCTAIAHSRAAETTSRPNIVLVMADDLGYGELGCYGHSKFRTPHLDRMAAEGAKLTQFNTPVAFCAPTRASLLTGRYPFRCGMTSNPAPDGGPEADKLHLSIGEILLPQLLKKAGYATGMIGKWHLGHSQSEQLPTHRGFDEYFGILYSNDMRPVRLVEEDAPVEYPVVQANLTRRYTDRALAFLEKNKTRPFFLYFAHAMPHKPLAASEAFYKKSGAGLYGDVIAELDASVGEVLARIKSLGLDEQTLVVFTSDNGATFGGSTGGLRGMKGSTYEGGFRVPCIARWPGKIPAGHVSAEPAVMMDLFSTALQVADVRPPVDRDIDGRFILPLFTGDEASPHEAILGNMASIRNARWKLHVRAPSEGLAHVGKNLKPGEHYQDPRGPDGVTILAPYEQAQPTEHPGLRTGDAAKPMQLFDLKNDPAEQHDVAAEHPQEVARLKALYDGMSLDFPPEQRKPARKL